MALSPSGSSMEEAKAFLAAHPEIEAFDILLTDSSGVGRGKIIRREELPGFYENGRHLPTSLLGLDIMGEDVPEAGLLWEGGDGDQRAWPVPGTLVPLHGTSPARGQVMMTVHHLDGRPVLADPRQVMLRQVKALEAEGFRPAGAFELEFFLLARGLDANGKARPAPAVLDGRESSKTEVYSLDHLQGMEPLFSAIYADAKGQGIPAETVISEFAPGQYELTLHYRTDIMRAADDLVMLKRIVRAQARRFGLDACFMAKPVEGHPGSGMHFHISLPDLEGRNAFTEAQDGQWPATLLHALGGLASTMSDGMLVFAPHANSWRRFVSNAYAPVAPSWGVNNRSVALRVPASEPVARRIEHRVAGVDANPYLIAATVLAGIRKGLSEGIDPGPETVGNGYADDRPASPFPALPEDWRSAIRAAEASPFLKDALGEEMHRVFTAIKRAEYLRVARTVTELDFRLYLHEV